MTPTRFTEGREELLDAVAETYRACVDAQARKAHTKMLLAGVLADCLRKEQGPGQTGVSAHFGIPISSANQLLRKFRRELSIPSCRWHGRRTPPAHVWAKMDALYEQITDLGREELARIRDLDAAIDAALPFFSQSIMAGHVGTTRDELKNKVGRLRYPRPHRIRTVNRPTPALDEAVLAA